MLRRMVVLGIVVCMVTVVGCSGGGAGGSASAEAEGSPAIITLPDGWTIESIITEQEVGAVTGKTMTYFPEASSAAQNGKPKAGYTNEGAPDTKLAITVDVAGGTEHFEGIKQFTKQPTIKAIEGLGDEAYTATFTGDTVGVVVLRGDAVIRIDWPPAVYGDDAVGMGTELAELLMSKMYR